MTYRLRVGGAFVVGRGDGSPMQPRSHEDPEDHTKARDGPRAAIGESVLPYDPPGRFDDNHQRCDGECEGHKEQN